MIQARNETQQKQVLIKTAEEIKRERMIANLMNDLAMFIPYLEEKTVTDIAVPDNGELIVTRFGTGREFTGKIVPNYVAERIIRATSAIIGKPLESYTGFPILEGIIPKYNARITAILRPTTPRPELQIRKPPETIYSLEDYVANGQMTQEQYEVICQAIAERKNIIVAGVTGCGKTTCTNAIIQKMVEFTPHDNFYIVEDVPELQCKANFKHTLWIPKELARKAVEESLRFSPDRIIFGEVRTSEVMKEVLDAWRTHSGNVTTMHGTSGRATLSRIKSMVKDEPDLANNLSEMVQLIVHLKKTDEGIRVDELFWVSEETDAFLAGISQLKLD